MGETQHSSTGHTRADSLISLQAPCDSPRVSHSATRTSSCLLTGLMMTVTCSHVLRSDVLEADFLAICFSTALEQAETGKVAMQILFPHYDRNGL